VLQGDLLVEAQVEVAFDSRGSCPAFAGRPY
jgi:hypothetical protein